jgi:broad specificity phosphatase PhoE
LYRQNGAKGWRVSIKKNVLLIRHAECESNATDIHQAGNQVENDPITEKGIEQRSGLIARLTQVPIDVLITSGYLRTRQTGHPLTESKVPHVIPVCKGEKTVDLRPDDPDLTKFPSLLREIDVPSQLEGLRFNDPRAKDIKQLTDEHRYEKDYRVSDEENLHDLWRRAEAITAYLEGRPEQTIAVISHGGILKVWLAHIMFAGHGDVLSKQQQLAAYRAFARTTWWDNTGVVSLQQTHEGWRWLMSDNSHLHPLYFGIMPFEQQQTPSGEMVEGESRSLE